MHPYREQPDRAFWKRSVSNAFDPAGIVNIGWDGPLIRRCDRVMSAGSCFAANIVRPLEEAGLSYVRTEELPAEFSHLPENLGYRNFSAAYGNIYTARQLLQLLTRSTGDFRPVEDRWHCAKHVIDPFRQGLRYAARSDIEFDVLTEQHLRCVLSAFRTATLFVFTLGLTECWRSKIDGAVYPACPGTINGEFAAERHEFHNFSVAEIVDDLREFIGRIRVISPGLRLILSVSPVPLVATATAQHVLAATIYSKSVLRVAAQTIAESERDVTYFPAYEIVTGPQAANAFESDRREPSKDAIANVMAALLSKCEAQERIAPPQLNLPAPERDFAQLAQRIGDLECEEAASGL